MRADDIDNELVAANPWWFEPRDWEDRDVHLGAAGSVPFSYDPRPLSGFESGELYTLSGPRRAGKSTALKRVVAERLRGGTPGRRILYVSLAGRSDQDLADVVGRGARHWLEGAPGQRLWVLDDVTDIPRGWPAMVKRLREGHGSLAGDTVMVAGSSSTGFDELTRLLSARGRPDRADRVLFQMSFAEVALALDVDLPASPRLDVSDLADDATVAAVVAAYRPWLAMLVEAWDRYLRVGGYPEAVAAAVVGTGDGGRTVTDAFLWPVVHGEALAGSGLTRTGTQTLLRAVASSLGGLLSVHAVAEAVGLAHGTMERRLDALRRAFLAFPVPRERALAPRSRSRSKWYFTDPFLARMALGPGGVEPDPAALSEQQLAVAILRALEARSPGAAVGHDRLLYYRSTTRAELDFVSADFPATCVESRFVDRAWGRAFQTIRASGRRTGVVATRSGLERHERGWALPAGFVAFVLNDRVRGSGPGSSFAASLPSRRPAPRPGVGRS